MPIQGPGSYKSSPQGNKCHLGGGGDSVLSRQHLLPAALAETAPGTGDTPREAKWREYGLRNVIKYGDTEISR